MKDIPPPGLKYGSEDEECDCICHKMPGVHHVMACCDTSREMLKEIMGQLTKEDYEKLNKDKK